jgi:ABC-2 type transport system permease protein
MNAIMTVVRKELRTAFGSPVALIFLGVFLAVTLFTFFSYSKFFARNIADVRPLFEWLPILMIFLVAAFTMRQWAEEQRTGTLEVLLTLPLRTVDLVVGKFVAALVLVGVGLALTLPLPLTVAAVGPLDWGPVIGGYVGALLLASAYLAIGLCVSARTDNQVVALMVTLLIGGVLYLLGSERVTGMFAQDTSEILRALGTGSRFESIARGVLDLRDLAYYVALTATFLALNVYFLEERRIDERSKAGRDRSTMMRVGLVLLAGNAFALVFWLTPIGRLRVDLTENGDYSVSSVTATTLSKLDEPLLIQGFFSERTHPLLAPLIPQIRDTLAEYEVRGDGKVRIEILDPSTDDELQQEIAEKYGIKSVPFRVADRQSQAIVNAYFHVLVRYGDQYQTLPFEDLIEVSADEDGMDVRLRNPEYDLTRAIKKVSQEFQSIDAVLAKMNGAATVTAYISAGLPESAASSAEAVRKAAKAMADASGGTLSFQEIDPSGDAALRQQLLDTFQIQPFAADILSTSTFYLHMVVQSGNIAERLVPSATATEADVRTDIEASLRRMVPGQLKRVGIATELPEPVQPNPQMPPQMQPPQPRPDYRGIRQILTENYEIVPIDLPNAPIPSNLDVLVIGKTGPMTDELKYAVDQTLMRGGAVIAYAGAYGVEATQSGLNAKKLDPGLSQLLASYGVKVGEALVLDPQNAPFPIPVQEKRGPFTMQRIELIPYPFFADIRQSGFHKSSPILSALGGVTTPWASPIVVEAPEGVEVQELLRTSDDSWTDASGNILPDLQAYPETGFKPGDDKGAKVVAVALTGSIKSAWRDGPPQMEGPTDWIGTALPGARLVVVGSSEMPGDLILQLAGGSTGEVHRGNIMFLQNAIDWAVEDTELLSIRTAGAFARTLEPMDDDTRRQLELANYAIVALALGLVAWLPRRRAQIPLAKA